MITILLWFLARSLDVNHSARNNFYGIHTMKTILALLLFLSVPAYAKKLKPGDNFPLLQISRLKPLSGSKNFAALSGKVVLVDFWASWCGPCKEALPNYDKLYKKFGKNGFVVIGVNVDDEISDGEEFLKEHGVSFNHVFDEGKKIVAEVGVESMPTSFLVDKNGKIKRVHSGFREGDEVKLEEEIKVLLNERRV